MKAYERFLKYVTVWTSSDEDSTTVPTTKRQLDLGNLLVEEMNELGLSDVKIDEYGYVYGYLPATEGMEEVPALALIAHMDTAPDYSGCGVKPQIIPDYNGEDVALGTSGKVLSVRDFPRLKTYKGRTLITTDGTTLLGADDKAGIAEILTAAEELMRDKIPHGKICIGFTPDEEVGCGADFFDVEGFGADFAYTVDGGAENEIEYENFNAAEVDVLFHGVNIHPGEGKNKLRNACLMAAQFIAMVPPAESPAHTEGYEGFYHLCSMTGDESQARLQWLIRDHDWEGFRDRKRTMEGIGFYLETRYGVGTVEVTITDAYYNMKEEILPHPQLLDWAREAFRRAGVEPRDVPIRGGTDGAKLSWRGLPCPNLSTGGYHFHGVHEYIPVEALETMANVLVHLVTGAAEEKI